MSFSVYHNPQNVRLGGTAVMGVQSIVISTRYVEIHAAGDGDTHESVARYATARTAGAITLLDPVSARAVSGAAGTLTFTWKDVKGLADKTVTIANCSLGCYEATVARDHASHVTLPFIAESNPLVELAKEDKP